MNHGTEHHKIFRKARQTPAVYKKPKPCGSGLCCCYYILANCSSQTGGLQYIPELPKYIHYLHFNYNQLRTIPPGFFDNVTQLTRVDLSHNDLTAISPEAFRPLRHLTSLFLSDNKDLSYSVLQPVLAISTLEELDVMSCDLGTPPADLFHNASLPRLHTLMLHDNEIGLRSVVLDLNLFKPLSALKVLGLASNDISGVTVNYTTGLEKVNLDTNGIFKFPVTCSEEHSPHHLFPRLNELFLEKNKISFVPDAVCLPRLRVMSLAGNEFSDLHSGSFSTQKFPRLTTLYMHSMHTHVSTIEREAFNNSRLEEIMLSFNKIKFYSSRISDDSFSNCPHLRSLGLSYSSMEVNSQRFRRLFGHLTNLRNLNLENTRLNHLSSEMLSTFPNLTNLLLNRNLLTALSDSVFDQLGQLKHLDLGRNQIRAISHNTFSAVTRSRLKSMDLSGNPFTCSCDLLWFQDWLVSNPSLFKKSWTTYDCHNLPDTSLQHFHLPAQACMISQSASIMIIGSISFVIITMTVVFSVFRFRWHLRLLLYEAFRGRGDVRRRRLEMGHFDYDIFVSYDSGDLPWVRQHLVPELEGHLGLRLCVHERDFLVGGNIVDNIADSVERSKKVMMLFSNTFVQSQWCQFELTFCLRHVMDYDDELIIVCLDDVSSRELTAAMMAVLKTTTYIQWVDDTDAIASFWGRLGIALQEVIRLRNE